MNLLRLFTDEDIHAAVALALGQLGLDAISTPEAGRLGELDEAQLTWATQEGRVLVTFNTGDFVALHTRWMQGGIRHGGIVVSAQRPIGDLVRRLQNLATSLEPAAMQNRLGF